MPKRRLHSLRAALRNLDKRPRYAESAGHCSARGRDWASETPRSLRRPPSTLPLHCTHPSSSTDSTYLRPRHAMGYLRLVVIAVRQGTPRPAGGTVVGNFVQPPYIYGAWPPLCLQPASARRRAPRGPGRGGLGEYWVCHTAVISGPATAGPGSQVTKGFRHGRFLTPGFTPLKLKLKLNMIETESETETAALLTD